MTIEEPDLEDLHQLRTWVLSQAKLWWGFGVSFGYLAIAAVPVTWLIGWQEYAGPLVAVVLAICGRVCVWRSEGYREDGEWAARAIELNRGIGHEIDATRLADLRLMYFSALQNDDDSESYDSYYEASGDPSPTLLIKMEHESAWWTGQLAKKASNLVFFVMGIVFLISVALIAVGGLEVEGEAANTFSSDIFRRAYGLAICVIILLDTFSLGLNYHRLSMAAKESVRRLAELLDRVDDLSTPKLMIAVTDYQSARKEGPLIPDWFWRYHKKSLNHVWGNTMSTERSRD